jgi:hypothetical protein
MKMMADGRDPTETVLILWLVSISDGVAFDNRPVADVREELLDVAAAAREVGLTAWADRIEAAAKSTDDQGPDAIKKLIAGRATHGRR